MTSKSKEVWIHDFEVLLGYKTKGQPIKGEDLKLIGFLVDVIDSKDQESEEAYKSGESHGASRAWMEAANKIKEIGL